MLPPPEDAWEACLGRCVGLRQAPLGGGGQSRFAVRPLSSDQVSWNLLTQAGLSLRSSDREAGAAVLGKGPKPEVTGDLTKGSGHLGLTWLPFPVTGLRAAESQPLGVGRPGSGWPCRPGPGPSPPGALVLALSPTPLPRPPPAHPLLQWPGPRAGLGCVAADRELALGLPSESSPLFLPLTPLGRQGLSSLQWPSPLGTVAGATGGGQALAASDI